MSYLSHFFILSGFRQTFSSTSSGVTRSIELLEVSEDIEESPEFMPESPESDSANSADFRQSATVE